MLQFLFPRRPLARSTLLTCHLLLQLGLVIGAALWLVPRTPWVAPVAWVNVWPTLALGVAAWLLSAIGLRLLAELWLLPYHLSNLRPGFTPGAVITRSFERRPAVHDEDDSWTSEARPVDTDTGVVGSARVRRPAERLRPQAANHEPTVDLADADPLGKGSP
ncbi:hypothetical protein KG088_13365 [Halomonas sp. TRM85114]|uniref:hypothetical protein n=1 Tax=Halomonas jincaotanensis TaxID=2810616 RepID=UPI001BD51A1B|nr:hypothetical protein [Halomonas jincaotanensis]MBS9404623.1 hypothetical protein [Halomonas jincaotanensis]